MSRGYTVMEVMMSLGILGVGAAGVVALQKATLIGNTNARNITTANAIAQSWVERLRTEALQWNAPAGIDDLGTDTQWLKMATTSNAQWFNPAEVVPKGTSIAGSPDSDVLGMDIFAPDTTTPAAFCAKMRLTRLLIFPNSASNSPDTSRTIRAEIRVFWYRSGRAITCSAVPDPDAAAAANGSPTYGFVSVTTAIVQNTSL